jgi:hypothetical protein
MAEFWLDIGSGIDAEHWAATGAPPGVRKVALEPLLTSGRVESGRLAPLPPEILRVGGEVRPAQSVEAGKQLSFLPFRSEVFARVHCGFVLHLYLECLELLAEESRRVLRPGGELRVLVPHFGDSHSEAIRRRTTEAFRAAYGEVEASLFAGPFTSFWADLYQGKTYQLRCIKGDCRL